MCSGCDVILNFLINLSIYLSHLSIKLREKHYPPPEHMLISIIESFVELPKESLDNVRTCVTLILGEYLSKDIWNSRISNCGNEALKTSLQKEDLFVLPTSRALISRKSVSFSELNSNIQLLCLLLEGIGIFAIVLREHFKRCS
jgi:hypothetical protein